MKTRIVSAAEAEFADAALYYLEESPDAVSRFLDEVEEALAEVGAFPSRYPTVHSNIRAKVLNVFPFTIFYQILTEEIRILAIAHHARNPERWTERE